MTARFTIRPGDNMLRVSTFLFALGLMARPVSCSWKEVMINAAARIQNLPIPYDHDKCLARVKSKQEIPSLAAKRTGVVVAFCDEDLSPYVKAGCRNGRVQYYIYSKCGKGREEILRKLSSIRKCFTIKEVFPSAYTFLTGAEQHNEYLSHIIRRYDSLEGRMVFTSAKEVALDPALLLAALDNSVTGSWDYKPLPITGRAAVRFDVCPDGAAICNQAQWGRELCAIYKRYTCEADCYSCTDMTPSAVIPGSKGGQPVGVNRCFSPVPAGSFLVSRRRLQEAPVNEYMWLREWLQSWQEDGAGMPRREAAERMWPALLGCPEDIHQNSTAQASGCLRDFRFPAGLRLDPPEEMLDDGLVHWTTSASLHSAKHVQDPNRHSSKYPYPHLLSPKYGSHRRITFIATFGSPEHLETMLPLARAAFGSALMHHPSARFILLCKDDAHPAVAHRMAAGHGWFAKRLEIHPVQTGLGAAHGSGRSGGPSSPLPWEEAHATEMVMRFLRDTVSLARNPEVTYGHIAVVGLNSVLLKPVWNVFKGHQFTLAVPVLPPPAADPLDTRTIFIHRGRIKQAASLLAHVYKDLHSVNAWGQPVHHSFSAALREGILWCQTDKELRAVVAAPEARAWPTQCTQRQTLLREAPLGGGTAAAEYLQKQAVEREEAAEGAVAAVRLLPCGLWGASSAPSAAGTASQRKGAQRTCKADPKASGLVRMEPPDGAAAWRALVLMGNHSGGALLALGELEMRSKQSSRASSDAL